jgi:protein TonB
MEGYKRTLKAWLAKHDHYPEAARKRGETGIVIIGVTIEHDGEVSDISVLQSSGNPLLDNAALETLTRDRPPPLPGNMKFAKFRLPVTFRQDSSW